MKLDPIEAVIEDFSQGKIVVLVDDADRENEGDLCVAADCVQAEHIAFMQKHGKGLICAALGRKIIDNLRLGPQVTENRTVFGTNFTSSVDHYSLGESGISATGRAKTVRELVNPDSKPEHFRSPGWIFPLSAVEGGVFRRSGQTEGSVDLARLAGRAEGAVICEVMNQEGDMLSGSSLQEYCEEHQLKVTSVEALRDYRLAHDPLLRKVSELVLEDLDSKGFLPSEAKFSKDLLKNKTIKALVFLDEVDGKELLALQVGEIGDGCLLRMHSECLTGDVFSSSRCDCGPQLAKSMEIILEEGKGLLIYLQQEGRGIGLSNKIKAYELQDGGLDTVDANTELGFEPDSRSYNSAIQIIRSLGLTSLRLITNNPEKVEAVQKAGIKVQERIPVEVEPNAHNVEYLKTKKLKMGHLL